MKIVFSIYEYWKLKALPWTKYILSGSLVPISIMLAEWEIPQGWYIWLPKFLGTLSHFITTEFVSNT